MYHTRFYILTLMIFFYSLLLLYHSNRFEKKIAFMITSQETEADFRHFYTGIKNLAETLNYNFEQKNSLCKMLVMLALMR